MMNLFEWLWPFVSRRKYEELISAHAKLHERQIRLEVRSGRLVGENRSLLEKLKHFEGEIKEVGLDRDPKTGRFISRTKA